MLIRRVLLLVLTLFSCALAFSSLGIGGSVVVAPFSKAYIGYWDTVSFNDDNHNAYYVDASLEGFTTSRNLTATFDLVLFGQNYVFRYSHGIAERMSYGRSDLRLARRYGPSEYGLIFSGLSFGYRGLVSPRLSSSNTPVYFDGRAFTPSQTSIYLIEELQRFMMGAYVGAQLGEIYLSASVFFPFLSFARSSSRLTLSDAVKSVSFPLHPGSPPRLSADISRISVHFGFSIRVF